MKGLFCSILESPCIVNNDKKYLMCTYINVGVFLLENKKMMHMYSSSLSLLFEDSDMEFCSSSLTLNRFEMSYIEISLGKLNSCYKD